MELLKAAIRTNLMDTALTGGKVILGAPTGSQHCQVNDYVGTSRLTDII